MHWTSIIAVTSTLVAASSAVEQYRPEEYQNPYEHYEPPEFHHDQVCINRTDFDRLAKNYQGLMDAIQNERDSREDRYPVQVRFPLLKTLFKKDFDWQDWYEKDQGSEKRPYRPVTYIIGDEVFEQRNKKKRAKKEEKAVGFVQPKKRALFQLVHMKKEEKKKVKKRETFLLRRQGGEPARYPIRSEKQVEESYEEQSNKRTKRPPQIFGIRLLI